MNQSRDATAASRELADRFAAALRDAAAAADPAGRLPAARVRALRAVLESSRAAGRPMASDVERILGRFEDLPPPVRRSLVHQMEEEERWRLRAVDLGRWHHAAVRRLRSKRFRRLSGSFGSTSVLLVRDGPQRVLDALGVAAARWNGRRAPRPRAGSMLRAAGLDLRSLGVYYARGLAQPFPYRGFWHDPARNVTVGCILGIDLVPTAEGFWYLESNLNAAIRPARTALFADDADPYVVNLCRFAQERGYGRLVVVLPNNMRMDSVMAARFEREAAARGVQLELLEDAFLRTSRHGQTFRVPDPLAPGTLVVRMKRYRTNLEYVFHNKRASQRALAIYQDRSGDRDVRVTPTLDDPIASGYDPGQPFPNLVYKMPDRDRGTGLVFLKAASLENARELVTREVERGRPERLAERLNVRLARMFEDRAGVFQPYIVGPTLEGRRLYYVRAHALLTPVGEQYLSAHRIVSHTPVPHELPDGIVKDPDPYFWKPVTGARIELVPPDEEPGVLTAALGVARGLSAAAAYGFQTGPAH